MSVIYAMGLGSNYFKSTLQCQQYAFVNLFNSPLKFTASEAVGAEETPYGGWSVMRLRSAAHGTANVTGLTLGVGPKGGLGEQGDSVPRQLILTKISLVERRPDNYEVRESVLSIAFMSDWHIRLKCLEFFFLIQDSQSFLLSSLLNF